MSMTAGQLKVAIAEARRFVTKAESLYARQRQREEDIRNPELEYWDCMSVSPKDTGAVRRASMDLTRSLADLRRA